MKKTLIVFGIFVALLGITACTRTEKNVATGTAVGAVAGHVIGGSGTSTVIGAGLGAGVGAIMSEKDK